MSHHHDPHQAWCTSLCVAPPIPPWPAPIYCSTAIDSPAWPAPTGVRHALLFGGPDGGKIVPITGTHLLATPAIFPNGFIAYTGRYEWEWSWPAVGEQAAIVGQWYHG
jgi:hypothetical protein